MSSYAIEEIDEAIEDTKELLLPFDWKTWGRLMVIVFFTGAGFSGFNFPSFPSDGYTGQDSFSNLSTDTAAPDANSSVTSLATGSVTSLILLAAAVLAGVLILFMIIGSVFEFVYYQSLLNEKVRIRTNFRKHFWKGIRYLLFRITVIGTGIAAFVAGFFLLASGTTAGGIAGVLLILAVIILALPTVIFLGLTQNFVLLKMMETEKGVLPSWKKFYPELKEEWKQVAIYLVVRLALSIAIGIAGLIWLIIAAVIVAIPFGLLTVAAFATLTWLAVIPVLLGLLALLVLSLGFNVVTQTFMRHYMIRVYHEITA